MTEINDRNIKWYKSIVIDSNSIILGGDYFRAIFKHQLYDQLLFPKDDKRMVYVIRMMGNTAVQYPKNYSPTIYIGQGNPVNRLVAGHTEWLAELLSSLRNIGLRIEIAVPRQKNFVNFYKHIESDMIDLFIETYGSLPLMNGRREPKYSGNYEYSPSVIKTFRRKIMLGKGSKVKWSVIPTSSNSVFERYIKGVPSGTTWKIFQ